MLEAILAMPAQKMWMGALRRPPRRNRLTAFIEKTLNAHHVIDLARD
jgi:hypothetical protein